VSLSEKPLREHDVDLPACVTDKHDCSRIRETSQSPRSNSQSDKSASPQPILEHLLEQRLVTFSAFGIKTAVARSLQAGRTMHPFGGSCIPSVTGKANNRNRQTSGGKRPRLEPDELRGCSNASPTGGTTASQNQLGL
jgi:hypothetical protein